MSEERAPKTDLSKFAEELGVADKVAELDAHLWRDGLPVRPFLQLDDASGIPFLKDISGVEEYQHRARLRCHNGDLFAAVTPVAAGYEEYCQRLDLGAPELLLPEPVGSALEVSRACQTDPTFPRLVEVARRQGGLYLHPYMAIEAVWQLARRLAKESKTVVRVLGPPPVVTWIANDKARFSRLVELVLGPEFLVETHLERTPQEIAAHVRSMARKHERVGMKRTRCASAMGNAVYRSSNLLPLSDAELMAVVNEFLVRTEWTPGEEVLTVAWEETRWEPSTQLWLPPLGAGAPRLDGIYEQILAGETRVFLGSRPSTLPEPVHRALADAALAVAGALQSLGYVGRCSFDHLIVGDPWGEFRVVFTECNGRWGGTSTPMSLIDRLLNGARRPPYRAQDFAHPGLVGACLDEICRALGDSLFDRESGQGSFILYNLGPLARSGKLDVIAMADTQEAAEELMLAELPRRIGL